MSKRTQPKAPEVEPVKSYTPKPTLLAIAIHNIFKNGGVK